MPDDQPKPFCVPIPHWFSPEMEAAIPRIAEAVGGMSRAEAMDVLVAFSATMCANIDIKGMSPIEIAGIFSSSLEAATRHAVALRERALASGRLPDAGEGFLDLPKML